MKFKPLFFPILLSLLAVVEVSWAEIRPFSLLLEASVSCSAIVLLPGGFVLGIVFFLRITKNFFSFAYSRSTFTTLKGSSFHRV